MERGSWGGDGEARQRAPRPHLQRLLEQRRLQDSHHLQRQDSAGAGPAQGHRSLCGFPSLTAPFTVTLLVLVTAMYFCVQTSAMTF